MCWITMQTCECLCIALNWGELWFWRLSLRNGCHSACSLSRHFAPNRKWRFVRSFCREMILIGWERTPESPVIILIVLSFTLVWPPSLLSDLTLPHMRRTSFIRTRFYRGMVWMFTSCMFLPTNELFRSDWTDSLQFLFIHFETSNTTVSLKNKI